VAAAQVARAISLSADSGVGVLGSTAVEFSTVRKSGPGWIKLVFRAFVRALASLVERLLGGSVVGRRSVQSTRSFLPEGRYFSSFRTEK
jgi:hypothetical protein